MGKKNAFVIVFILGFLAVIFNQTFSDFISYNFPNIHPILATAIAWVYEKMVITQFLHTK